MTETSAELFWTGRRNKGPTVLLAHGAGAGSDSEFQVAVADGLAAAGLRVARFDFPYMQKMRAEGRRRGPDAQPKLLQAMRDAVVATKADPAQLVLAGKSMGGRMATMVADELAVAGVIALGYPFHPPGNKDKLRTAHLAALRTPCLILQGERDTFGTREEVPGYTLSQQIEVAWLPDGNHSLEPRKASGHTAAENLRTAIDRASAFVHEVTR